MTLSVVVIGKNEGVNLAKSLSSIECKRIVYVDSNSTDNSVAIARKAKAVVVKLDDSVPCTAARGRNAGFKKIMEKYPDTEFVQFVDGDCVLEKGWLKRGISILDADPSLCAVMGHLSERDPNSVYHRLCQLEWTSPVGESSYFSGVVMLRAAVFESLGGYREKMAAGEEPELSTRMRLAGYHIEKDDTPMAIHDADIRNFRQWLIRVVRSGNAIAEGFSIHGKTPLKACSKEYRSILFWGGLMPIIFALTSFFAGSMAALVMVPYVYLISKIYHHRRKDFGESVFDSMLWSVFCVWAKFPQLYGVARYHIRAFASRGCRQ